jgi:UDP-4-amino-4,6-dideoxy-N-acetyl-beta-L-altrosamine transaminase
MNMIPYGKQEINKDDVDAVLEALSSDFLTQGPKVPAFENAVACYTGATYGVAVNSATSALHIACLALGLGKGDWLWTSAITFVASANCGIYCGAKVDFVDIDPDTYNMCTKNLEKKLKKAQLENKLPKVVIPVHLSGQPCDMLAIKKLSVQYGFRIIEDASHAIGGKYDGKPIGSCQHSDITVFSFHPVKIITTAEGGLALTNCSLLSAKLNLLRSHGITRDARLMDGDSHGGWYYQQIDLGFNYRMTELQAALGISQMSRLDDFVTSRHELASRYNELLSALPVQLPMQLDKSYSGMHLYIIRLHLAELNLSHKEVFEHLVSSGVGVNLHYIPVYSHPFYKKFGFNIRNFPESEKYYQEAISIPMFHGMSIKQQDRVIEVLMDVLS